MIVAAGKSPQGRVLIVGLTDADVAEMKKGLTKTKQGNADYGFSSMVVFMGPSDQANMELLNTEGAARHDDMFRDAANG